MKDPPTMLFTFDGGTFNTRTRDSRRSAFGKTYRLFSTVAGRLYCTWLPMRRWSSVICCYLCFITQRFIQS